MTETITGTLSRVNTNGFQIQERPGVWWNLSKFNSPQLEIPTVLGTEVRFMLDDKNFVRAIEPQEPTSAPSAASAGPPDRDRTITRLALIKAAARFLADKPDATSTDVELVAAKWERWVRAVES